MEEPAVAGADRHAAMAARVAGQGDEQNLVAGPRHRPDGAEAEPVLAARLDRRPAGDMRQLRGEVAGALAQGRRAAPRELGGIDVDGRVGKVGEAPGVVEVEVGRHDVADVGDAKAEVGDLAQRRLGDVEPRPDQRPEQAPEPRRIGTSSTPRPLSTRTSPSSPSISRQWQHIGATAHGPPFPPKKRPPRGHREPQLRW